MKPEYLAHPVPRSTGFPALASTQLTTIREAIGILEQHIRETEPMTNPTAVKSFCRLHLATEPDEHFCGLFLDSQHRLIVFERLFRGTVDGASVYPRVVVRRALELNAAALVVTHNHPSGITEPSHADRRITERLREALALVDVRVLDHIIVGTGGAFSFAENGMI